MIIEEEDKIKHNNKEYVTVVTFAAYIKKTSQTVYRLMKFGNSIRKLRSTHIGGKPFIELEELYIYPFVSPAGHSIYYHNKDGTKTELNTKTKTKTKTKLKEN